MFHVPGFIDAHTRQGTRVKGIMRQGITIGNVTKHFKEERSSTITFDQFLLQIDQTFTML